MRKQRAWRSFIAVAISTLASVSLTGCGSSYQMPKPKPTVARFQLTHHVGGTHYRVLVNEGRCIQAFGNCVQIVDPKSLLVINDVPLGEFGHCGPVVDLAINGERLYAVVEDDAVAEFSLPSGLAPKLRRMITSAELGIQPRSLSVIDGDIYVSGVGGVVNLASGERVFTSPEECGSVARAGDDLVVCVGRRVNRVADGRYVGAASNLQSLPADLESGTAATLIFTLRGEKAGLAGLMTPDVREVVGGKTTIAMPEAIHRIRVLGKQIFVVGPTRIDWYDVDGVALKIGGSIDILGALDIDQLDRRTFFVVGTAGRAIYQLDESLMNGAFIAAQREASALKMATGDGLNILAGSREGAWMYLVNARAELTTRTIESAPPGPRSASTVDAQATITTDGTALNVKPSAGPSGPAASPWEYREEKGAKLRTIIAVDGDFWIGHDRGITVLKADGGQSTIDPKLVAKAKKDPSIVVPPPNPVKERLRIPGPVLYLAPLLAGNGASYVSELGGFGVARYIDEEIDEPTPVKKK